MSHCCRSAPLLPSARVVLTCCLRCARWLRQNKCAVDLTVVLKAMRHQSLDLIKQLVQDAALLEVDNRGCLQAIRCERLDVLQWLRSEGWPWTEEAFLGACAVACGDSGILAWMLENSCPVDDACLAAVAYESYDALKVAMDLGHVCSEDTVRKAFELYTEDLSCPSEDGDSTELMAIVSHMLRSGCSAPGEYFDDPEVVEHIAGCWAPDLLELLRSQKPEGTRPLKRQRSAESKSTG